MRNGSRKASTRPDLERSMRLELPDLRGGRAGDRGGAGANLAVSTADVDAAAGDRAGGCAHCNWRSTMGRRAMR
jgi:hypothetical protein